MWTGHWAPALILKTLTPKVPLGLLFFVSILPDFLAFTSVFLGLGVENADLVKYLPGTFRYATYMPYTHSLAGTIALALICGGAYYLYSGSRVNATSIFLAVLSHFPLEIPEHRKDLRIFPSDQPTLGFGMFDSYLFTFAFEGIVIGYAYYNYVIKTRPFANDKVTNQMFTAYLGILLGVQHVLFSFNLVPTENVQFVHSPMFLMQIIFTSLLAHLVDGMREDNYSFWSKAEGFKREVHARNYVGSGKAVK